MHPVPRSPGRWLGRVRHGRRTSVAREAGHPVRRAVPARPQRHDPVELGDAPPGRRRVAAPRLVRPPSACPGATGHTCWRPGSSTALQGAKPSLDTIRLGFVGGGGDRQAGAAKARSTRQASVLAADLDAALCALSGRAPAAGYRPGVPNRDAGPRRPRRRCSARCRRLRVELPWWQEVGRRGRGGPGRRRRRQVLRLLSADRPAPPGGHVTYLAQAGTPARRGARPGRRGSVAASAARPVRGPRRPGRVGGLGAGRRRPPGLDRGAAAHVEPVDDLAPRRRGRAGRPGSSRCR